MHAFLITGNGTEYTVQSTKELAKRLNAKIMEFPLVKIEDVRNLNNLLRLTFSEPALVVCRDIHEAGEEALNAFLKNLEEPQENIYFALTAPSARKVLPTIVSRCQIIKIKNEKSNIKNEEEIKQFLEMSTGQKLAFFDKQSLAIRSVNGKIKHKDWAIGFVESLIFYLHKKKKFDNMEILLQTLTRLKANGNVNLQLTNLLIEIKN